MKQWVNRNSSQSGFTLLEAIVAMGLMSVVVSLAVGQALMLHDTYHNDMVRTQINGNLRSAMDVISMNIRQTGENLQSSFPALELEDGTGGNSDVLYLRRNRLTDVLALCDAVSTGATSLPVSRADLSVSQCVNANIVNSYNAFENIRNEDGGISRIYIYDTAAQVGEFLDYSAGSFASDVYYLLTSDVTNDYPALTTAIYVVEEFSFAVDSATNLFTIAFDGDYSTNHTVAFDVNEFQVNLLMDDGTTLTELYPDDPNYDWKNVRQVEVNLSGIDERKGTTYTSSVSARYFPRNVLSYDG